jgi:hypothetical protein
MNLLLKSAVAVALLSAASVSAYATSVTPPSSGPVPVPGLTNGGIVVEVYDLTTGVSMTEWLGSDVGSFGAPSATPAGGGTLDYGILGGSSQFSSLFSASEIAAGDVSFTVSGVSDVNPVTPTVDLTLSKPGTIRLNTLVSVASAANTGVASILNAAAGCNNANPCIALNTLAPGYAVGKFGGSLGGLSASSDAAGTVGGAALDFFQIVGTGQSSTLQTPVQFGNATGAASWTLSASGDLVYSVPVPTSAVPLPAAVWLLGSGLLGLAGVGRRKSKSA